MPADLVLARELKSLQDEAVATQRDRQAQARPSRTADLTSAGETPMAQRTPAEPPLAPDETAEELAVRDQLRDLVDQVTQFFQNTENNIATHPAESVIAALLVGILIGRVLGRG